MNIVPMNKVVQTHGRLDKNVKQAIEKLSRKLAVPQCAIINSLCYHGLKAGGHMAKKTVAPKAKPYPKSTTKKTSSKKK